jgi:cAMP-dependent protein kinase regulator
VLREKVFEEGVYVIRQGDDGNDFYLIMEGEAEATLMDDGKIETIEQSYSSGDYFGELALIRNKPRAANIRSKSKLRVAMIDRKSFKRLLGPLE